MNYHIIQQSWKNNGDKIKLFYALMEIRAYFEAFIVL